MLPKVAIVILNWNGKHFLERFLQLLINRTPEEYAQIIVADNGSTDGSVEYCATISLVCG
jgi:glycosyltransferase involved in cell wall biosynthesis